MHVFGDFVCGYTSIKTMKYKLLFIKMSNNLIEINYVKKHISI